MTEDNYPSAATPSQHAREATPSQSSGVRTSDNWTIEDANSTYRVDSWSNGYFSITPRGTVQVNVPDQGTHADLQDIVQNLRDRGLHPPFLLRFEDILVHRLKQIRNAFETAIQENNFTGEYQPVYPIKVNQQQHVVDEIAQAGTDLGFGLEVGSKPELIAVMGISAGNPNQLIICNGFKDRQYIDAVVLATKLGRRIVPVIENLRELRLIVDASKRYVVKPTIGVRVKLSSSGAGRWSESVGKRSKFGLYISELLRVVKVLKEEQMLDCLKLLHCHAGSQFQDIKQIKDVISELTHVYTELHSLGVGIDMLDIGGGLGVDYKGDQTNAACSMNYTLEEFASDVVYRIGSICDSKSVPHPHIVTECGRAMVAYSSVLVFDVIGSTGPGEVLNRDFTAGPIVSALPTELDSDTSVPQGIHDLRTALDCVNADTFVESFHDAATAHTACQTAFTLGYSSLEERALADLLYWKVCDRVRNFRDAAKDDSEELNALDEILSDVYFSNFSIFQSLPDAWAIDQLFPVMPIHRLDEQPTERVTLGDITCDSDGKLDRFIDEKGVKTTLETHTLNGEPYTIGVFLVGAYQETLGDLHNLFGDAHAVHVELDDDGWGIREIVHGDTAREVLSYVQYEPKQFYSIMSRDCENARRQGRLSVQETRTLMTFYETSLNSYTYLEHVADHTQKDSQQ